MSSYFSKKKNLEKYDILKAATRNTNFKFKSYNSYIIDKEWQKSYEKYFKSKNDKEKISKKNNKKPSNIILLKSLEEIKEYIQNKKKFEIVLEDYINSIDSSFKVGLLNGKKSYIGLNKIIVNFDNENKSKYLLYMIKENEYYEFMRKNIQSIQTIINETYEKIFGGKSKYNNIKFILLNNFGNTPINQENNQPNNKESTNNNINMNYTNYNYNNNNQNNNINESILLNNTNHNLSHSHNIPNESIEYNNNHNESALKTIDNNLDINNNSNNNININNKTTNSLAKLSNEEEKEEENKKHYYEKEKQRLILQKKINIELLNNLEASSNLQKHYKQQKHLNEEIEKIKKDIESQIIKINKLQKEIEFSKSNNIKLLNKNLIIKKDNNKNKSYKEKIKEEQIKKQNELDYTYKNILLEDQQKKLQRLIYIKELNEEKLKEKEQKLKIIGDKIKMEYELEKEFNKKQEFIRVSLEQNQEELEKLNTINSFEEELKKIKKDREEREKRIKEEEKLKKIQEKEEKEKKEMEEILKKNQIEIEKRKEEEQLRKLEEEENIKKEKYLEEIKKQQQKAEEEMIALNEMNKMKRLEEERRKYKEMQEEQIRKQKEMEEYFKKIQLEEEENRKKMKEIELKRLEKEKELQRIKEEKEKEEQERIRRIRKQKELEEERMRQMEEEKEKQKLREIEEKERKQKEIEERQRMLQRQLEDQQRRQKEIEEQQRLLQQKIEEQQRIQREIEEQQRIQREKEEKLRIQREIEEKERKQKELEENLRIQREKEEQERIQKELILKQQKENELKKKKELDSINNTKNKIIITCKSFIKPPLIGLDNIGSTCYMNATLQCFSQTELLTNYFLNENNSNKIFNNNIAREEPNSPQLSPSYLNLINNLWKLKNKSFPPIEFRKKLAMMNPLFKEGLPNDAKDLVTYILTQLHSELNDENNKLKMNINNNNVIVNQYDENSMLQNFVNDFFGENCSVLSDHFYGIQETKFICSECQKRNTSGILPTKYNFQTFNFIIFPLEEVRLHRNKSLGMNSMNIFNPNMNQFMNPMNQFQNNLMMNNNLFINNQNYFINNNVVNIYDCFEFFQKEELFTGENSMWCNECKGLFPSKNQTFIYSGPNILILILNRGRGIQFKIKLDYYESIDLNKYIIKRDIASMIYDLYGVVTHLGESGDGGHFVASCKSPCDNKWYRYNDSIVFPIKNIKSEIIDFGNSYILFYRKRK